MPYIVRAEVAKNSETTDGWFALRRGTLEHEIFAPKGAWTRFEAWVWMIEAAAYRPKTIDIGGKPYTVERGCLCFSQRFLAAKFKWSKKAVTTFLEHLEAHGAIKIGVAKTGNGTRSKRTQVSLCNYDKYQATGAKTDPKGDQKGTKEEQVNNIPVGEASPSGDPKSIIFGSGLALLQRAGLTERQARGLLGKWCKDHGDAAVIDALGRAQREGAIDPVAFIGGCFRFQAKKAAPSIGDMRVTRTGKRQEFIGGELGWVNVV